MYFPKVNLSFFKVFLAQNFLNRAYLKLPHLLSIRKLVWKLPLAAFNDQPLFCNATTSQSCRAKKEEKNYQFSCKLVVVSFCPHFIFLQEQENLEIRRAAFYKLFEIQGPPCVSCIRNRIHHLFYGNLVESFNLPQTKIF